MDEKLFRIFRIRDEVLGQFKFKTRIEYVFEKLPELKNWNYTIHLEKRETVEPSIKKGQKFFLVFECLSAVNIMYSFIDLSGVDIIFVLINF